MVKKKKAVVEQAKLPPVIFANQFGMQEFEVEVERNPNIDWDFAGKGRSLEVTLIANVTDIEAYKWMHDQWFGENFIKNWLLNNDSNTRIDQCLHTWGQKRILLDYMLIEAMVMFEDPADNFYGEFSSYHGYGFTVSGNKYLDQYRVKPDA